MLLTEKQHKYAKAPPGWKQVGLMLAPYTLSGYNLCPSASTARTPSNLRQCIETLDQGFTVAVPFIGNLPDVWHGYPVFDGDEHDLWFLNEPGVCGLSFKGKRDPKMGCSWYCLNVTGRGSYERTQKARIRKARALMESRQWFLGQLRDELPED